MNCSPPSTGNTCFRVCPSAFTDFTHSLPSVTTQNHKIFSHGVGMVYHGRSRPGQRHLKFVLAAQLSNPLSHNLGFDSQPLEYHDVSELHWIGPIPGDIAEVEAYCRILRAAENLHRALMDILCQPVSGEGLDSSSLDKSLFEDKIVPVLGRMVSLLNKGRQDVLSGRLECKLNALDEKLPPLAIFRGEIKRYCESLHVVLDNILSPSEDNSCHVWTKLQRLKNICYDLGFPREDDSPQYGLFANWTPVYFSTSKEAIRSEDSEVAFSKGGQVTEEGLKWLIDSGFKSIVDLRDEAVKDSFYDMALEHAIECGEIELIKLPVEVEMAPSKEQVEKFASLVADTNRRPVYLHSREGVWRTSAMISRWRQYIAQFKVEAVPRGVSHEQASSSVKAFDQTTNGTKFSNEVVDEIQSGQSVHISPLKAQVPPENVFCRKTMSQFFKKRKISPLPVSTEGQKCTSKVIESVDKFSSTLKNESFDLEKHGVSVVVKDGVVIVGGEMCASSTGVVRVQSRRKAEMFLVRTDGIACNREKVTESSLAFTHPSTQQQMLLWKSRPKTVLLLKKLGQELIEEAKQVALFLHHEEQMNIVVEQEVHDIFARIPGLGFVQTFIAEDARNLHEKVDFVACLGGDGVILHASNLFKGPAPPVVSFNLGSLGFLTSHSFEEYKQDLRKVIHGNNTREGVYITLRMRLRCEIHRNGKALPGKVFDIMNEVVVDRGSSPYLSKIECYENDRLITKVQGDGIIVATPTGSTAYSTAAGGSMVHPNVPCILFTPICPHSLSFRPVILPDSASFELKIPEDARSNAWASFDGKKRKQLFRGDSIRIFMSEYPLPTVNKLDQTGDWFHSLVRCLNWNERLEQKPL